MKRSISIITTFLCITFVAFFSGNLYSQQEAKTADQGKTEAPKTETNGKLVGTYLDVYHAREHALQYDDIIKNDIYKLRVVIENFGDENEKNALKSIMENHVNGKKEIFKRRYLSADKILTEVKASINKLYMNISDRYQKKANDILGQCAENLVDKEIGIGSTRDINVEAVGKTSRKITENRIKLLIAYDQLNMADKFKFEERLADAITHYRIAKTHGINILIDLAESDNDKNKVKTDYKVDIADGDNLISK